MQVIVIGRERDCNIILSDVKISRHHAQLVNDGGKVTICDLNSKNGTYVNGVRIFQPKMLNSGDIVMLGGVSIPWQSYLATAGTMNQIPVNQIPVNQPPSNAVPIQDSSTEMSSVKKEKEHKLLPLWISLAVVLFLGLTFLGIRTIKNRHKSDRIDKQVEDSLRERRDTDIILEISQDEIAENKAQLDSIKRETEKVKIEAEKAKAEVHRAQSEAQRAQSEAQRAQDEVQRARNEVQKANKEAQKAQNVAKEAEEKAEGAETANIINETFLELVNWLTDDQLSKACKVLGCSTKDNLLNKFKASNETEKKHIIEVLQKSME